MLPRMNMADPDAPGATDAAPAEAPPGPSRASLDSLAPHAEPAVEVLDPALPRGCPFLLAGNGGWRLDKPSREHRCAAVSPPAALSLEKQARLCLTPSHATCATYLASITARGERLGAPLGNRTTRWGLARTTTVIEDAGGLRSRIVGLVLDRGRWPAIPAVILVVTLLVLAVSGLGGGAAIPTPGPSGPPATPAATAQPSAAPTPTSEPEATPTEAPSAAPTPTAKPTKAPAPTFQTYKVKPGDTLSAIAAKFGTTSRAIADLNGISVTSVLRVGQVLKIPN
jgi:LysM repeat protein